MATITSKGDGHISASEGLVEADADQCHQKLLGWECFQNICSWDLDWSTKAISTGLKPSMSTHLARTWASQNSDTTAKFSEMKVALQSVLQ